jgi:predicted small secreted protein
MAGSVRILSSDLIGARHRFYLSCGITSMRSVWGIVVGLVLALMTAGCNTTEEMLIERGIGTELPSDDIVDQTRRMALYLNYLCAQAGMSQVVADGTETGFVCDMKPYGGAGWSLLVRAGFNDIDRRCDSYLAWLNSRRRNRAAILDQITDTRTFTEALLYTTGAGAAPIAIAGLAFGLASNSFTNYYSRLLFEIEKSTVQVLVHQKRL